MVLNDDIRFPACRIVVLAFATDGVSYGRIAAYLGMPEGLVIHCALVGATRHELLDNEIVSAANSLIEFAWVGGFTRGEVGAALQWLVGASLTGNVAWRDRASRDLDMFDAQ